MVLVVGETEKVLLIIVGLLFAGWVGWWIYWGIGRIGT